ncbi:hypothetical protein, partial [Salmonella enterica]|uniref:hypothetical protein n=1 Tax=Salmonella enterica TaxID=28901 RepID=UPI0032B33DF9
KFDQSWNAGADWRLERVFADPAEAKRAEPGFVGDTEQIIAFDKSADGTAFAISKAALSALHEAASPCVGCGIAYRAEGGKAGWRREGAAG